MKKAITISASLFVTIIMLAQAPQSISYQAVIRNSSNQLVTETQIGMQISILQGAADGSPVYTETQSPTTNSNGLVSIEIGAGTTSDDISSVDWTDGPYFIKTETDPAGGSNYTITGTSQLLSVPYALHAKTAEAAISSFLPFYTMDEIIALSPSAGEAIYNTTENLFQIYDGNRWVSLPANCWPQPTTPNAGNNQTFNDGTISTTLSANTPEAGHGTGQWSIVSGDGGSFDDDTSPTAVFTGAEQKTYYLRWTISTNCQVSEDDVMIGFYQDTANNQIADIEENTYNTVWIGDQNWMAENLKTTKYSDGTTIPNVTDNSEWDNLSTGAYAWYDNDQATYGDTYGALYNWYAVDTGNLCPSGWHVPSDEEWKTLEMHLGMSQTEADDTGWRGTDEGGKLKETGTTHWNYPNEGATNENGFTALPGGYRNYNGFFYYIGTYGSWWSATEHPDGARFRALHYDFSPVLRSDYDKEYGFSVRCLRD